MEIRVIRNDEQYQASIERIRSLILSDPLEGSAEREQIDVLSLLIEDYERQRYQIGLPDPIDAIKFRMEQANLRQRDLVPYIGSRSKVSEVLNRKRPLSLPMIRALSSELGVPAEVLLQAEDPTIVEFEGIEAERFPLREMIRIGWVDATSEEVDENPAGVLASFMSPLGSIGTLVALYRKTDHVRSARRTDHHALAAWTVMVKIRAMEEPASRGLTEQVNMEFMRELARLSDAANGPALAKDFLNASGIALVILPHLPGTYLDGASLLDQPARPIIAMTLRHDRLDNFWFTLMHEIAHIALHAEGYPDHFYDDLDLVEANDDLEIEADRLASEALIPEVAWERSAASRLRTAEAAEHLARGLEIHPAIVAGRMRYEFKSYRILSQLIGYHEVRRHFPEVEWND